LQPFWATFERRWCPTLRPKLGNFTVFAQIGLGYFMTKVEQYKAILGIFCLSWAIFYQNTWSRCRQ